MNTTDYGETLRVEVCSKCGRHAHFLCGDDQVSGEFLSQSQGEGIAKDFQENGDISFMDFQKLMQEIHHSGLPMEIPHEMQYLLDMDEKFLHLDPTFPDFDEEDEIENLHEFLTTFFPETSMTLQ